MGTARTNKKQRVDGQLLQRIRRRYFAHYPLCVMCEQKGVVRLARELDHIIALDNGGLDFDRDNGENRQGLCVECHAEKTRRDLGHKERPAIGADGFHL